LPPGCAASSSPGLLSALMGSLAGVFNACSTLFTVDLYQKLRPKPRSTSSCAWAASPPPSWCSSPWLWIPVVQGAHGLYDYLQSVQGYLAPPIFVVFFFGVFWKRLNAQGCLWAMVVGFVLGIFRMAVDTPVTMKLAGFEHGYEPRLLPLDRQQHQLPVLQHPDHARLGRRDGRRQLRPRRPTTRGSRA
jgi:solute:Na+ symporter, SSS family